MNDVSLNTAPVRDARDQLIGDLQSLTTHAQDLLHATRSLSDEAANRARERLNGSLATARQQLTQLRQAASERSQGVVNQFDAELQDRPRETVAAVALASLAVGVLSRGTGLSLINGFARIAALGIAGVAGSVLWSFQNRSKASSTLAKPVEEGRWESEGGSPAGVSPSL